MIVHTVTDNDSNLLTWYRLKESNLILSELQPAMILETITIVPFIVKMEMSFFNFYNSKCHSHPLCLLHHPSLWDAYAVRKFNFNIPKKKCLHCWKLQIWYCTAMPIVFVWSALPSMGSKVVIHVCKLLSDDALFVAHFICLTANQF